MRTKIKFDPAGAYVARRVFRYNGEDYQPGDDFILGGNRHNLHRSRILFDRRFITLNPESGNPSKENSPADDFQAVQRSPGWYDVKDAKDTAINDGALRKAEAEALTKALAPMARIERITIAHLSEATVLLDQEARFAPVGNLVTELVSEAEALAAQEAVFILADDLVSEVEGAAAATTAQ